MPRLGAAADLLQLALERPRPREEPAVERVEAIARREEHETAGHADGNADGAALELDCKTLAWHLKSPMRAAASPEPRLRSVWLLFQWMRFDNLKRCSFGGPGLAPPRDHAAAQGVRLVPYCCPDEFPTEGIDQP